MWYDEATTGSWERRIGDRIRGMAGWWGSVLGLLIYFSWNVLASDSGLVTAVNSLRFTLQTVVAGIEFEATQCYNAAQLQLPYSCEPRHQHIDYPIRDRRGDSCGIVAAP